LDSELEKNRTCAKNARVLQDGRIYQVDVYNLDVILSVGCKVNSKRGTLFRKWAKRTINYQGFLYSSTCAENAQVQTKKCK